MNWNRTHDWIVERRYEHEIALAVIFKTAPPSIEELKLVRRLVPEFSNGPPGQFRQRIRDDRLDLGVLSALEARATITRAAALGLRIDSTASTRTTYVFEDRTVAAVHVVEDDDQAAQLASEMIAAGVPVREVEVD